MLLRYPKTFYSVREKKWKCGNFDLSQNTIFSVFFNFKTIFWNLAAFWLGKTQIRRERRYLGSESRKPGPQMINSSLAIDRNSRLHPVASPSFAEYSSLAITSRTSDCFLHDSTRKLSTTYQSFSRPMCAHQIPRIPFQTAIVVFSKIGFIGIHSY